MFAGVKLPHRVDEPQSARTDQIIHIDVSGQVFSDLKRHPFDEGKKFNHELIEVGVMGASRRPTRRLGTAGMVLVPLRCGPRRKTSLAGP